MSKFGTIVVSKLQAVQAAKGYLATVNGFGKSDAEAKIADRVLRAATHNRVETMEIPADSPLVDFLLVEQEGKLLSNA